MSDRTAAWDLLTEFTQSRGTIVLGYKQLSARVAVHLAVMESNEIDQILSFDRGFDFFPKIIRLS